MTSIFDWSFSSQASHPVLPSHQLGKQFNWLCIFLSGLHWRQLLWYLSDFLDQLPLWRKIHTRWQIQLWKLIKTVGGKVQEWIYDLIVYFSVISSLFSHSKYFDLMMWHCVFAGRYTCCTCCTFHSTSSRAGATRGAFHEDFNVAFRVGGGGHWQRLGGLDLCWYPGGCRETCYRLGITLSSRWCSTYISSTCQRY